MDNILSEYPRVIDHELTVPGEALHIDGVGMIGQYHSYLDTLWEKGIPYFVRDVYLNEFYLKEKEIQDLLKRINFLNSKIQEYECLSQCTNHP